jgi:hypothetical protein
VAKGTALIINEDTLTSLTEVLDAIDEGFRTPVVDENYQLLAFAAKS